MEQTYKIPKLKMAMSLSLRWVVIFRLQIVGKGNKMMYRSLTMLKMAVVYGVISSGRHVPVGTGSRRAPWVGRERWSGRKCQCRR